MSWVKTNEGYFNLDKMLYFNVSKTLLVNGRYKIDILTNIGTLELIFESGFSTVEEAEKRIQEIISENF